MSAGNEGEGGRRKGGSGEEVNVLCSEEGERRV